MSELHPLVRSHDAELHDRPGEWIWLASYNSRQFAQLRAEDLTQTMADPCYQFAARGVGGEYRLYGRWQKP